MKRIYSLTLAAAAAASVLLPGALPDRPSSSAGTAAPAAASAASASAGSEDLSEASAVSAAANTAETETPAALQVEPVAAQDASSASDSSAPALQSSADKKTYGSQTPDDTVVSGIKCPDSWNKDDPEWFRAYQQIYGTKSNTETGTDTADQTAASTGVQVLPRSESSAGGRIQQLSTSSVTTWDKYGSTSKLTFYHDSRNTSGKTILPVIDVSYHNGTINWSKVKAAGVQGVIIRCGYRGSSTGALAQDVKFKENIRNAKAAGLKVGVYIFSQAVSKAEGRAEANYAAKLVKSTGYSLDLPMVIDVEYVNGGGRLENADLAKSAQTSVAAAFCAEAESLGYQPMVYASSTFLVSNMDGASLASKGYRIWMARYSSSAYKSSSAYYQGAVPFWQCSSQAAVNGISSRVDLNYWYATRAGVRPEDTSSSKPAKVTGVKASSVTGSSVTLSWNAAAGASSYQVFLYKAVGHTNVGSYTTSKTSRKITGLKAGEEYYFKVRAYSSTRKTYGSKSSRKAVTTSGTASKLRTATALSLRKYAGTGYQKLTVIPSGKTMKRLAFTYDKTGKKWYKVFYSGKTGYLSASYTRPYTDKPTGLKVKSRAATSISLSWKKAAYADYYRVYRKTSKKGSWKRVAAVTSASFKNTKLARRHTYYYCVKAVNRIDGSNCASAKSGTVSAKTR
ncbi:MAG: GH25 family lysozyme [Eubacterium sp.]|jgi:GH25 family lysozyme M1 (1,4-beta-N-acetylmuramidase)